MINSFEYSNPLGFGNQQEEEEDKGKGIKQSGDNEIESETREKGEMVLNEFVYRRIVRWSRRRYPNFPLEESGRINVKRIIEQEDLSEGEREEIKKELQKISETITIIKARGGSIMQKTKECKQSEKLLIAIIHKVMGDKLFAFRSAPYDDFFNKVDIIIAEQTGKEPIPTCVLDVTVFGTFDGEEDRRQRKTIDGKMKVIYDRNLSETGARLNFFGLKDRKRRGIPIFCVPLKRKIVSDCLDNFTFSLSREELKIFGSFIASIKEQVARLESGEQPLSGLLKNQIYSLKIKIQEWEDSYKEKLELVGETNEKL